MWSLGVSAATKSSTLAEGPLAALCLYVSFARLSNACCADYGWKVNRTLSPGDAPSQGSGGSAQIQAPLGYCILSTPVLLRLEPAKWLGKRPLLATDRIFRSTAPRAARNMQAVLGFLAAKEVTNAESYPCLLAA